MKPTLTLAAFALLCAAPAVAQQPAPKPEAKPAPVNQANQQAYLDKVKAEKKYFVLTNLPLTDAEMKAFLPLYEEYQGKLVELNDRADKLIYAYADLYRNNTMTDEKAGKLIEESLAVEAEELAIKKAFLPKLMKAIPAAKAARYMQIENKLRTMMKMELAAQIPLVK